ncbi:MAG: hypothetical protein Q4G25_07370 [Paracoccus sp. (in: a-proteobacteria)]|nr:hypothetical protein [Paracoccus sp. (in: a-proteobacteria)]
MSAPDQQMAEARTELLVVWLGLGLLASVLVGAVWYVAPLAMGFLDAGRPDMARRFLASWSVGLPLFALGQIAALILAFWRLQWAAIMATALLAGFLVMIGLVLLLP